jgi:four helix bundle protein
VQHFTRLKVWAKAHELCLGIYRITRGFPPDERYGLTSQLRRAAASVSANIVEGIARSTDGETTRFLSVARSSAAEVEYFLLLAKDLGLLGEEQYSGLTSLVVAIQRMLNRFLVTLRKTKPGTKGRQLTADG